MLKFVILEVQHESGDMVFARIYKDMLFNSRNEAAKKLRGIACSKRAQFKREGRFERLGKVYHNSCQFGHFRFTEDVYNELQFDYLASIIPVKGERIKL